MFIHPVVYCVLLVFTVLVFKIFLTCLRSTW